MEPAPPAEAPEVTYQAYANGRWWSEITGCHDDDNSGFAGVCGKALSGLYARASRGVIRLRVRQIDGDRWLNWQENGEDYAGNLGKDIDLIQAELIDCPGYAGNTGHPTPAGTIGPGSAIATTPPPPCNMPVSPASPLTGCR